MEGEITQIWGRKFGWISGLFFVNRYSAVIGAITLILSQVPLHDETNSVRAARLNPIIPLILFFFYRCEDHDALPSTRSNPVKQMCTPCAIPNDHQYNLEHMFNLSVWSYYPFCLTLNVL